jgi:hypothetical protein
VRQVGHTITTVEWGATPSSPASPRSPYIRQWYLVYANELVGYAPLRVEADSEEQAKEKY